MGIKKFKVDNYNLLSFGQAVKIGVGISIISALLTIVYNQVFANFIEPDFMNQIYEIERAKWVVNSFARLSRFGSAPFLLWWRRGATILAT